MGITKPRQTTWFPAVRRFFISVKWRVRGSRATKHNNAWTVIEYRGKPYRFQSKKEARRAFDLMVAQDGGLISGLQFQVWVPLVAGIRYRVDFVYVERGGEVYEDAKGHATEVFRIKAKLFKYCYPDRTLRIT